MQQLFGQKVLNEFIEKQDEKLIESRWQKFKNFLAKKEKISSWIETDYQDGFLEDIFENCLGYISKTRSTNEHYTLEREKKNEINAQKADGALLVDDRVVAVIELKDLKTKDLDKKYSRDESAVRQAFGYLQHNNYAKYVIVSNFNELRFYFDKATAYEQFFLFDLDYEGFKKLHTILSYESISKELPHAIKEKSLTFEQDISNQLYKDYTTFRSHLFENILKNNPQTDKLSLLNATQKLIDRIVFILFGEDTDLLPKNTIGTIIQRQKEVKKLVKNFTLYDSYKVYFEAINEGDEDLDITKYNGGLFAYDAFLDAVIIDDEVLDARAKILSAYNFGSDISVNILGHIFENSISELEEISAQLLENDFDKKQSKRKKDGVFYTPAYITEYIVQNTLGKLCEEKRAELNITEVEAIANPKKPTKKEQERKENLLTYKEWLLNLKILDPACGSGAFLNQALEYLLKEHKRLQNDLALMGDLFASYEVEKEVLEHNLYGVDINEGAVEIARLSLWLRTAKRGRPLTKLANKIKVGNSLIDDKTIVPNAFDWHAEFPEVFVQGGFDVVIGNPPYVNIANLIDWQRMYFQKNYITCKNKADLYAFFIEKATMILKFKGKLSFIMPHTWVSTTSFEPLRRLLFETYHINALVSLGHGVFQDAVVKTVILVGTKNNSFDGLLLLDEKFSVMNHVPKSIILNDSELVVNVDWSPKKYKVENKIFTSSERLEDIIKFTRGIKTSNDKRFLFQTKKNDEYKKVIRGRNIKAYQIDYENEYIWYRPDLMKEKVGCLPHTKELFEVPEKLITQRINSSGELLVAYDNEQYYCLDTTNVSVYDKNNKLSLKYLLLVLNSRLINWWFNDKFKMPTISGYELKQIPIKDISELAQQPFIQKADKMLSLNKNLQETKQNFLNELGLEKLTKKLQNFEELTFDEFIAEYTKALKLKFADKLAERNFKQEWQALFENDKTIASTLKTEIQITDKEIDKMVYELYGLSDEEIKIVEGEI